MSARYQVINKGRMWHVVDRSTGKTIAIWERYRVAMQLAQNWALTEAAALSRAATA